MQEPVGEKPKEIRYRLQYLGRRVETGTIETLRFMPNQPIPFQAGQWIHLAAAEEPSDRSQVRHMSFCSAQGDGELEFTMDLATGSPYKEALRALEVGETVAAFKIRGEFPLPETIDLPVFFLAGGIGITPMRSMLRDRVGRGKNLEDWALLHVSRGSCLFETELLGYGGRQWRMNRGAFQEIGEQILARQKPETRWWVSGSERFVEGMTELLRAQNIAEDKVKVETFKPH